MKENKLSETIIFVDTHEIANKDIFIKILQELEFEFIIDEKMVNGVTFFYIKILNIDDLLKLRYIRKLKQLLKLRDVSKFRNITITCLFLVFAFITVYLYFNDFLLIYSFYNYIIGLILFSLIFIPSTEFSFRIKFNYLKKFLIDNFLGKKGIEIIKTLEIN